MCCSMWATNTEWVTENLSLQEEYIGASGFCTEAATYWLFLKLRKLQVFLCTDLLLDSCLRMLILPDRDFFF